MTDPATGGFDRVAGERSADAPPLSECESGSLARSRPEEARAPDRLRATATLLWKGRYLGISALSAVGFFTVWHLLTRTEFVSPLFLPPPSAVWDQAARLGRSGELPAHILTSMRRVFVGYLLSASVAIPLGVFMGSSRAVKAFVDPVLSLIRPLPSLSWIPLSILWFGIAEPQKYSIVFMGTFATLLLYVAEATKRVDPLLILVARGLGANTLRVMAEVVLPGALPGILSGLKVSLAVSWTVVLSAEMVAASRGLGALIWFGKDWNNIPLIMVGMALISLTVFVVDMTVRSVEGWIIPWERYRIRK